MPKRSKQTPIAGPRVEITEAMIKAGAAVLSEGLHEALYGAPSYAEALAKAVFLAMSENQEKPKNS